MTTHRPPTGRLVLHNRVIPAGEKCALVWHMLELLGVES